MKKFLVVLVSVIMLMSVFTMTACDNGKCTHSWSTYYPDGDRHYKSCAICSERLYSEHEFDADGYCECGADNLHHHKWQEIYTSDSENCVQHYQECEGCEEKEYNIHEYENGVCKFCNKEALIYQLNDDGTYTVTTDDSNYLINEITIPAEYNGKPVTAIADEAFRECMRLKSVTISEGITTIGEYTFDRCGQLTTVTIPNSVTTIGDCAFDGCALTSITLPDKLTAIGDRVFYSCDFTNITIPQSVTSIGFYAFGECYNLTSITLPDTLTYIGGMAFSDCKSLKSIIIPDRVAVIDALTFSGCDSLTTITLPETITDIGNLAFEDCISLTNITFKGTKEQWNKIGKGTDWNKNTSEYTIHCKGGDIVKNQTEQ